MHRDITWDNIDEFELSDELRSVVVRMLTEGHEVSISQPGTVVTIRMKVAQ